ncbi:hypothetical protein Taro_037383 [Colocasia esculenta]|uniref:Phytosulfokine n=1 Tax=Colocasia esculenta TaxID=4460 RepID=A0A843W5J4_COLES|nr:hypothetical protein [Colocasia esculenta]
MSKSTTLSLLVLGLLFASMTHAARSVPAEHKAMTQQQPLVAVAVEKTEAAATTAEGCGDECMMRRTLEAHLDYIYTQDKKH